ncbi:follistatin-related protein 5-like isoform X1 [Schistocerca nitens]|uniref:follistatin-related protein 5-like isoform X1 n=1 Tax=Schistocerca nitens TaxID=7011 RepID=UPI0021181DE5|nr:follistatin-related protein 5-like isoform X1 [Schistocerca nitens]
MMMWKGVLLFGALIAAAEAKRSRHHRDFAPAPQQLQLQPQPAATTPPPPRSPGSPEAAAGESTDAEDYDEDLLARENPCLVQFCGAGRECVLERGAAVCVCVRRCPRHARLHLQRPVCGSDGHLYATHCDLHRAACLEGRAIAVDHSLACIPHHIDNSSGEDSNDSWPWPWLEGATSPPPPPAASTAPPAAPAAPATSSSAPSAPSSSSSSPPVAAVTPLPDGDPAENEAESDAELDFDQRPCSLQEYEIMKDNLLLYNHAKQLAEELRNTGKEYLVSRMFSHYDHNNDGALEKEELEQMAAKEQLSQLSKGCSLSDMLHFDDASKDGRLDINEFYTAFSKLYSVSVVSLDTALQVNHLSARVGDNVDIKCDVTGTPPPPIVWRRYGADLSELGEPDVRVFSDGSLYLTRIQLVHAGNYTCHAQRNKDVVQTHVLTVHTIPEVKVTPRIQSRRPGEDASMFCHVVGEPFPKVEWLKNDEPLPGEGAPGRDRYEVVGNGTELTLKRLAYADTGAYMCQASNVGGLTRDISSLVVQDEPTPTALNEEHRFFAFHDWGVSVYEPTACRLYHQIQATDIIPGTQQEYVCGDKGVNCSWGQAINVANRYVYVAQPHKDRVLVISKIQMVVVDVVTTDKMPVELHYVPHLDQVWVLNWRSERDRGVKTVQVIRDAAQKRKHHTVHPEPIDGQFDLVSGLFMPPVQDMNQLFKYAYVTHTNQRGLYKLDLATMRYIRSIDLTPYNCVPRHIEFSALYGYAILECEEPVTGRAAGQVLLDHLSDAVLARKPVLLGRPTVAPDSRAVVTVDHGREGVTLVVQRVTENGLKFMFDVKTTLNISDITFYPSQTTHGYDLYASATDKEDILFLNLLTGKVEMITGVGRAMSPALAQWGAPNRPIASSAVFGHYMVTTANEALFVVNGETRTVNCEIGGLVHPRAVVWVTMRLQ